MQQIIIDNKQNGILGDVIEEVLEPGSNISIITSYFTIYAIIQLFDELKKTGMIRFLLSQDPFSQEINNITPKMFLGDKSEITFQNKLTLYKISKTCYELLMIKAEIMASRQAGVIGNKILYIETDKCAYSIMTPNSDFNTTGLGYIPSNTFVMNSFISDPSINIQFKQYFEQFWNNKSLVKDIKEDVLQMIKRGFKDYSPQELYYFTLYHIFKDNLKESSEEKIVKSKTGFKDTLVWNKLYNFQRDGVLGAIDKIERYNGCIIADSVGLGKTFEALAVIKYYELRNDRVLVLCPKKLRENWTIYTLNDNRNILLKDRFNYDVINHTDLTRDSGYSGEINLENINWSNYDLVVIDESHNFRNGYSNSSELRLTRYSRLMNDIIRSGVKTKVLMLSATPVNNRMNDLKNQVAFITEGDDLAFEDKGISNISVVMRQAQVQFSKWVRESERNNNVKSLIETLDARYFKLLDLLTIARSRKHIQKYYDLTRIGKFPQRLKPINIKSEIDLKGIFPELKTINREIRKLNLSAYSPLKYVRSDKKDEYKERYDLKLKQGSVFSQLDREQSLTHLMRVNMFKRMESSINSFSSTLNNLLHKVNFLLDKIDKRSEVLGTDYSITDIDFDDPQIEDYLIGNKVKVLIQDTDIIKWKQDLQEDKERLKRILSESSQVDSSRDAKLQNLKDLIRNKINNPINHNNKKVLIFTAFTDTALYIYQNIEKWALKEFNLHSAVINGSKDIKTNLKGVRNEFNDILTNFSPLSKERDLRKKSIDREIDLLIATDCISEGQNLQDCDYMVNYDIHWNPVRIIQRFGRIDRIGSLNKQIQLVNFWANMELDEYINLEARVSGRMILLDISATGEENVIDAKTEMNDLEYRRKQLEQLQDSVIDLEDIQGGISITDLTYNDFKIDLITYLKDHQSELENTPTAIHALTKINDPDIPEGVIFCLRQTKDSSEKNKTYNALDPYYLVFIDYNGDIVFSLAQNKQTLDYYQKLCTGNVEVCTELIQKFREETKNGKDMTTYTEMLAFVVDDILGIKREKSIASIFKSGGTTLTTTTSSSVNSFEVVSFLIIGN
ncbi:DEAD/DEAH box helicase family protein [bacterium]|nr:DEAD/DEAH box helicase family protein [bacterium]